MKILVTGGMGFIGSNFIRYLLNKYKDYEIINLDKLTYAGNPDNLRDIENNKSYTFVKGDICDKDVVDTIIKNVDAVINFAAETHVDRSITGPEPFIKTDVFGTYRLLEASRKYNVDKYIQISTDEVYGSIENGSFKETDILDPSSPYSASKSGADLLTKAYHKTYGLPILITRSSNNFGPYQYPEKLIPVLVLNALQNKTLPIYGDGKDVRDWLYVLDNCEGIDLILHKGKIGEIYNIASNDEKMNIEIANFVLDELNKPKSLIKFVRDRSGHDRRYSLDCVKIKQLGWKPKTKFEEGLRTIINWYRENEWWWEKIEGR